MSRPPAHLIRLAVQRAHTKLKQRNTSHAIPTDYAPVEITERTALMGLLGEITATHDDQADYWNHLAECRNVLMFGAGHMREQFKRDGGDPSVYIQILKLCDEAKTAMIAVKRREEKTGKFGVSGDDRSAIIGLVETSSEFWRKQPAWFFRDCVNAARKMHTTINNGRKAT